MVKCLECGFESKRLQWTHFKFNCSGRFQNGKEYLKAYPNASLLDPDIAKKTAITLENLIKKYGPEEGSLRWKSYRQKQADSNKYDYKKEKYGWTEEEFQEYNKSRSVTLKNMITKYGEDIGTSKWIEYCEKQAYTNTVNYFIQKYGKTEGIRRYKNINSQKSHSIENIALRNKCDIETAVTIWNSKYKNNSHISQSEKNFVDALEMYIGRPLEYTYKTKQYCVYGNNKANFYDIVDNNRAIEYHGDYWHCNPKLYESNYYHTLANKLAKEIWNEDIKKQSLLLTERKIDCLIIWENEFLSDTETILKRCKEWILKEKK